MRHGRLPVSGLMWVHLDMKTTCPRSSQVKTVQAAMATVWLETGTGEPC